MSVYKIDTDKCIGCGTCVLTCPIDVFRLDKDTGKSKITFQEDCQICHLCRVYCPVGDDVISISPVKCEKPMVGWA